MTRKRKLIYLSALFGVFIVFVPLLVLFSAGYTVDSEFRLVKTGGIYLVNKEPDIAVKLDGKSAKKAGMLEKNILISNLTPKRYSVVVEKDGYRPWKKNITVEEQKVEVCYPLLVPVKLNPQPIPKYLIKKGEDQRKKKREANEEYVGAMKLFSKGVTPAKGTVAVSADSGTTKHGPGADQKLKKKVLLIRHSNKIYVKWTGADQKRPFFIDSTDETPAFSSDKNILSFDFFPGRHDSMLVLLNNLNLYAVEIDTRFGIQNSYKIASNCKRFAVKDEFLYYFSVGAMYMIDFEP